MPGVGQGKFVRVYMHGRQEKRQEIFLRFWQTKGGRDVR